MIDTKEILIKEFKTAFCMGTQYYSCGYIESFKVYYGKMRAYVMLLKDYFKFDIEDDDELNLLFLKMNKLYNNIINN